MDRQSENPTVTRRQFGAAALSGAALLGARGMAAEPAGEDAFTAIFDGKTLNGWHKNAGKIAHGTGGHWQVEDGVLTGEQDPPGSGNGGLLLSDGMYGDFELAIEMRPDWGPDSGVFFRCTEDGSGFQMYVDYYDGGNVGHLRGEMPGAFAMKPFQIVATKNEDGTIVGFTSKPDPRTATWPEGVYEYSCTPEEWMGAWRIDDWNEARIRCVGKYPQITTWINGVKICHFNGETSTMPGYDKDRVLGILGERGSIGLQVHGGKSWPTGKKCRWRNIRIREL